MRGRVALVAGAGSGIGRAAALLLARHGARVACADLVAAAAEAVAREIAGAGGEALAVALDVTDESGWADAVPRVGRILGGLDVLVLAAGVSAGAPLVDTSLAEWRRVFAVNTEGVFLGLRHALPAMRAGGRGGSVVVVASASGIKATPGAAAYSASKAAARMLCQVAAKECLEAGDGIRVNVVSPAGVKTPLWHSMPFFRQLVAEQGSEGAAFAALAAGSGFGRFAEPEEIAEAILYLASDASGYVTGHDLVVDAGYTL